MTLDKRDLQLLIHHNIKIITSIYDTLAYNDEWDANWDEKIEKINYLELKIITFKASYDSLQEKKK